MNIDIEKLKQGILKIQEKNITERTYYPIICAFLQLFASNQKLGEIDATQEESPKEGVGFPDITVRRKNKLVGWMEVKLPDDNLNNKKFDEQFKKYKDALENIIFTNLREWQLWQWDNKGRPTKILDILFDPLSFKSGEEEKLENLLIKFFEGKAYEVRKPSQLALALAKKTKLFSKQVEESYDEDDVQSDLSKLRKSFEKTLIQHINKHQFANMVAETMAYSLFLAFLEHIHKGNAAQLTLTSAIDYLPMNIPILADLYSLVSKVAKTYPRIYSAAEALIDQLNTADMNRIYAKLVDHKVGEDPVIQFYEPFLKEYDPAERKARGVYYTPKPVVDFMVKSVDLILRDYFNKKDGLADFSVQVLDPATGTGTFLMSAIQQVYATVKKENHSLGAVMVKKQFIDTVINHILKHFYGFELMVAPYAIAHLKLTLLLEEYGFSFDMTKKDSDLGNDRIRVYLANTLDDPTKQPLPDLPGYHITEETNKANSIKLEKPIIAIIGNPPYAGTSLNMQESMRELVEKYKYVNGKKIKEKGALQFEKNLNDDYVKFISFSQSMISGRCGVISLITNNGYLDNPTLRGLRSNLINDYDEIYIMNLFGSTKKGDRANGNEKDESVFNIQLGTSIIFLIKNEKKQKTKKMFYSEIKGRKSLKYNYLLGNDIKSIDWQELTPKDPQYYFVPKDVNKELEYSKYAGINEVFPHNSIGIITARDSYIINENKDKLLENVKMFAKNINLPNDALCQALGISQKKGWNIDNSKRSFQEIVNIDDHIKILSYRPYDDRFIFYHKSLIWGMSYPIMKNFLYEDNLGIVLCRQVNGQFNHAFVTSKIMESSYISNKTKEICNIFPLYIVDGQEKGQTSLIAERKEANIDIAHAEKIGMLLGLRYITLGRGDLSSSFGPEDILYYSYAIFNCPGYRNMYAVQLKSDFPRLPITSDKELFADLVKKGLELVNLHLLGENPFDKSQTIFDDNNKWGVKIGGDRPENLDDWKVAEVRYVAANKRVYVNPGQYFEGIENEVWAFMIGGYQVCEKWLKDRKKTERCLSLDDLKHYMKIIVSLRETIRVMGEIDKLITKWPME